jgi:hypothetical protein
MANSTSHQAGSDFSGLWSAALRRYEDDTGRDLSKMPYFVPLVQSSSVDNICHVLREHKESFKAFRERGEKIRAVLAPIFRLVNLFIDAGGEVASASVRTLLSKISCGLIVNRA